MKKITQTQLKKLLRYDPNTGEWIRIAYEHVTYNKTGIGKVYRAGRDGYVAIKIKGKIYKAHQLAFLYMIGKWPVGEVDHKDRNPANNRWNNLRQSTRSQNQGNSKTRKDNSSGYRGVSRDKDRWRVRIGTPEVYIGHFDRIENAALAYNFAAYERFGLFAQFNKGVNYG